MENRLNELLDVYNKSIKLVEYLERESKKFDDPLKNELENAIEREKEHQESYWKAIMELVAKV